MFPEKLSGSLLLLWLNRMDLVMASSEDSDVKHGSEFELLHSCLRDPSQGSKLLQNFSLKKMQLRYIH